LLEINWRLVIAVNFIGDSCIFFHHHLVDDLAGVGDEPRCCRRRRGKDLAGAADGATGRDVAGRGGERYLGFRVPGVLGFRVRIVREDLEGGRAKIFELRMREFARVGDGG
jgi:hypothetical protein